jgi:hypothetical protein
MTATQDEHTGLQAIEVTTETVINHWELGRQFFDWDNEEQARFLHGAYVGHQELGGWGHVQIGAIVDATEVDGTTIEIRSLIELLRDYFKEEAK